MNKHLRCSRNPFVNPANDALNRHHPTFAMAALYLVTMISAMTAPTASVGAAPTPGMLLFQSETRHTTVWRRIYTDLPAVWKADQPIMLREVNDEEMEHIVAEAEESQAAPANDTDDSEYSVVDGCYKTAGGPDAPAVITLRSSLRGADVALVFAHEYGHYVWDQKLSESQRARYRAIWRRQRDARRLITRYAADCEEEGFAEAFSFYLRRCSVLRRRDLSSWSFLNGLLPDDQKARIH